MLFVTFTAMLLRRILYVASPLYKPAIAWLSWAFFVLTLAGLHFIVVQLTLDTGDWYFDYSFSILGFGIGGAMFVKAGYEFSKLGLELSENTTTSIVPPREHVTSLNVITYVASLASNATEIQPILEDVRELTSLLAPTEALTSAQEGTLANVYNRIETYLVQQEPLRTYTKEDIASNLEKHFGGGAFSDVAFLRHTQTVTA